MNGLDLFSGIGGISVALADYVRPVAYCESDQYAQAVLMSRMRDGSLPIAGVWDDVRTLNAEELPSRIDIIYGGFPCQDISVAGTGVGLEGKRSGLFFEIIRLIRDIRPRFVFLENVPAITTRGLERVCLEFTQIGYDSRWTTLSAASVGACHQRDRWFMLAHSNSNDLRIQPISVDRRKDANVTQFNGGARSSANANGERLQSRSWSQSRIAQPARYNGWSSQPVLCRGDNGVPHRVDRVRGLGNAVVPLQAKTAFERLMGISA